MNFLMEYINLNEDLQKSIATQTLEDSLQFNESELYLPDEEIKVIDKEQRISEFRRFLPQTHKKLFEDIKELIDIINENNSLKFVLVKNDLTHIRYFPGGFFKPHQDYLSLHTNFIEEYTMILCIDASDDIAGGQTRFHINPNFIYSSEKSITPGGIVIFRKDLVHEGVLLERGRKEILTVNLWAMKNSSEEFLILKSSSGNKFVINLTESIKVSNLLKKMHESCDNDEPIEEISLDFTDEEISIICDIISGKKIPESDYKKHYNIFDFFEIENEFIMTHLSEIIEDSEFSLAKQIDNVYIFSSIELRKYWNKNLENYDKFTLIFAEGSTVYDSHGDASESEYNFDMIYKSYNNRIIYAKSILRDTDVYLDALFKENENIIFEEYFHLEEYLQEKIEETIEEIRGEIDDEISDMGVECDENCTCDCEQCINHPRNERCLGNCEELYLRTVEKLFDKKLNTNLCKCCYNNNEAVEFDGHLVSCKLNSYIEKSNDIPVESIKKAIINKYIDFHFPQETKNINHSFCNESVYGKVNLIKVYGLIKRN